MNDFIEVSIREAANFLENTTSALIVCHVSPDGDTIGSALALVHILRRMGKKARAVAPSPVPRFLSFIADKESFIYEDGLEDEYESVITVDVASVSQLGTLSHLANITDLMIDHHSSGEIFADHLIEPFAAAAGETVAKIYRTVTEDGEIGRDPVIASYLYTAISADTGNFKYSNTSPETLRTAADLMEEVNAADGIKTDEISRLLHDTMSENDLKLFSLVTTSMKKYEDGSLVATLLTTPKIKLAGLDESDLGGAVDIPRKMENALVAFVLRQSASNPTIFKLSVRANVEIDVSEVCALFGGGGHVRAAGATINASSPGKALEMAVDAFKDAVRRYKSENAGEKTK